MKNLTDTKYKVSVVVPVYKTEKYLDECVNGIINQTEQNIEIILVDDGSPDNCPKMCDDYSLKDSRVKVIHKENGGLMSAWITGTKEASAPYMCYVDGDDWVDTDMIETLLKYTSIYGDNAHGIQKEIISSGYIIEKAKEKKKVSNGLPAGIYSGKELEDIRQRLLGEEERPFIMSRCMKLISKEVILNNLKYCNEKIRIAEDVNIMLPCMLDVDRIVVVPKGHFYHYRTINESMMHGYNEGFIPNLDLNYKTFMNIFSEKGISNGKYQMDREYVRMLFVELKNNELRGGKGYVKRAKKVFGRQDIKDMIRNTPLDVNGLSNKLLYTCMKHPNTLIICLTYYILLAYDKKTN